MKELYEKLKQEGEAYLQELTAEESSPVIRGREALFIYHEEGTGRRIKSVRLVHHVVSLDRVVEFERIGGGNLFVLHMILPEKTRLEYTFGIVYDNGQSEIKTDPFNKELAWCPFGPTSVVTTSQYRRPTWSLHRSNVPRGKIENHALRSQASGDTRYFGVYLPHSMDAYSRHPLLIVHDGPDYLNYSSFKDILDNLIAEGTIEPLIAVLSKPTNRNYEYSCTPEHSVFIAQELLPWMKKNYPVHESRMKTGLMGASFGAVASVYTGYKFAEKFGLLLLQSGSFRFQYVVRTMGLAGPVDEFDRITVFLENEFFPEGPSQKMRIFLSCGTFEPLLSYNRRFAAEMEKLKHQIIYKESNDGHNWGSWRDQLGYGLMHLFPPEKKTLQPAKSKARKSPFEPLYL